MSKRILITGGFGYLGGRIGDYLARHGYTLRLGSRRARPKPAWLPHAETVVLDVNDPASFISALEDVQAVVHLAAIKDIDCLSDPVSALSINALGTARLLQTAIQVGVKRFIYFSTAHVYCNPLVGKLNENSSISSLHPYATSHRAAEDVVRYAHQQKMVEGVVLRLSNAYGPPMHQDVDCWRLLANDLCRQAVMTKKMVLNSSGSQCRNFIPMTDVCRVVGHLLRLPENELGAGLFNVGGAWSSTVLEMATLIQTRCESRLGFCPAITRMTSRSREKMTLPLDYHTELLHQTGFQLEEDKTSEIDTLLEFCSGNII